MPISMLCGNKKTPCKYIFDKNKFEFKDFTNPFDINSKKLNTYLTQFCCLNSTYFIVI